MTPDISELLPPPDELSYDDRLAADVQARKGRLAYLLAPGRFYMNGRARQLFGYFLDEFDAWMVDGLNQVRVQDDGRMIGFSVARGLAIDIGPVAAVRAELRRLCERAELDREDVDFILSLPDVVGADKFPAD